ncbi:hypothetical protein ABZ949_05335 [Micromonospora tulbaghiae]|uniref:hypothetical protein n=1 Tax=Micromonospora tulbaghiae TaxID=479978 RepID=UPI0033EDA4DE
MTGRRGKSSPRTASPVPDGGVQVAGGTWEVLVQSPNGHQEVRRVDRDQAATAQAAQAAAGAPEGWTVVSVTQAGTVDT